VKSNDHLSYIENNTPVIFVPGLFGSMSNEIMPGTGNWSFDIAKLVYDPFIELLIKMGYRLNKNLFISFYDWLKSCEYSAKKYLLKTIEYVKLKTMSEKVNLICHSTGGLVASSYVQSDYYGYDVENMIIIATPNAGLPPNFGYWEGGGLPDSKGLRLNFVRFYMNEYMETLGEIYRNNKIEAIHTHFEGLNDILPSSQYRDYLFYKEIDGAMVFEPYSRMECKNEFLDELNEHMDIIRNRNVNVTIITGTGEKTINFLQVVPLESENIWSDGRVTEFSEYMDGNVNTMLSSVFCLEGNKYILHGSHVEILYKCEHILKKVLLEK